MGQWVMHVWLSTWTWAQIPTTHVKSGMGAITGILAPLFLKFVVFVVRVGRGLLWRSKDNFVGSVLSYVTHLAMLPIPFILLLFWDLTNAEIYSPTVQTIGHWIQHLPFLLSWGLGLQVCIYCIWLQFSNSFCKSHVNIHSCIYFVGVSVCAHVQWHQ